MAKIARHKRYGYRYIIPPSSPDELSSYYSSSYRHPLDEDMEWLEETLYRDIKITLTLCNTSYRLLDIGCGSGVFVSYMRKNTWDAYGIDPAQKRSKYILNETAEQHIETKPVPYDVVTMLNVLEHIPRPYRLIKEIRKIVKASGTIVVRVPNDFSLLQTSAKDKMDVKEWWVSDPDHQNYFDFISIQRLIESFDFRIIKITADFPMELFLLMGEDYVSSKETGSECHKKRKRFERSIPYFFRRRFYDKMAELKIGRNILVFAKKNEGNS